MNIKVSTLGLQDLHTNNLYREDYNGHKTLNDQLACLSNHKTSKMHVKIQESLFTPVTNSVYVCNKNNKLGC